MIRRLSDSIKTVQPLLHSSSSTPIPGGQGHRFLWKRIVIKTVGAVALISIFSLIASSQEPAVNSPSAAATSKKSGTVQLEASSGTAASTDTSSATTTQSGTVNGHASNSNDTSVQVTVNGQDVAVPENGSTQQTITSPSGAATVVNMSSNNSGNGTSFSSTFASQNSNTFQSNTDENGASDQDFYSP